MRRAQSNRTPFGLPCLATLLFVAPLTATAADYWTSCTNANATVRYIPRGPEKGLALLSDSARSSRPQQLIARIALENLRMETLSETEIATRKNQSCDPDDSELALSQSWTTKVHTIRFHHFGAGFPKDFEGVSEDDRYLDVIMLCVDYSEGLGLCSSDDG